MRLLKLTMFVFLISFICNFWGFSQFRIIPKINLEIYLEEGYLYPPQKLVFVGIGDENMCVRSIELDFSKRKYSLYNVKPGRYLLSIADDNAGIIFQYQIATIVYPDEDAFYRKNTGYLNQIEVRNNRNLKLKLTFKMHEDYNGYQKVSDVKYKDFDYSELIFYSAHFSGEMKKNIRETRQNPYSICGSNTGWSERSLGFSCSLDGGNININIKKAYFENIYRGEKPAGYSQGRTILGPDYSSNQVPTPLTCGVTTTTGYFLDNLGENNPHPNDWEAIIVTADCDENTLKCDIIIDYNVAVIMETAIWKKEEMCTEKNAYDNKPLSDQNNSTKSQCYCDCYLEAIIAHEARHCESWIDSTNNLNDILQRVCILNQNMQSITCCEDEPCQKYADENIKYLFYGQLSTIFIDEIINNPATSSPEGASNTRELEVFHSCCTGNDCANK